MNVQWIGLAHGGEVRGNSLDNFGLANGHRLKFRSNVKSILSKGTTESLPLLITICSGDPNANKPYETSRMMVRELTQSFRRDAKADQFAERSYERWLKFEFSEVRKKIISDGQKNPQFHGASTSCTCVIIDNDIAVVAQLGDTHLYHFRNSRLKHLSEGDFSQLIPEDYQLRQPYVPADNPKFFRNMTIGALHEEIVEPLLFRIELKKNDMLVLCTEGAASVVGGERIHRFLSSVKRGNDLETAGRRIQKRGADLCTGKSVGTIALRVK